MKLFKVVQDLVVILTVIFGLFIFSVGVNILSGCNSMDYGCLVNKFSRSVPLSITAAQMQEGSCAKVGKVWDEESHSCQWQVDIQTRRGLKQGFEKIPGTTAFRPGDHFWVSPTEVFGDLHEYLVAEDGSLADYMGTISHADFLTGQRREIIGPNGTPWFSVQVVHLNGEVWTFFNIVPGHVGWVRK